MPVPFLSTNEAYYCRKLSVYNLGLHSTARNKVIMNVWSEIVASRGADEIGSCLLEYCHGISAEGFTQLTAYSSVANKQIKLHSNNAR